MWANLIIEGGLGFPREKANPEPNPGKLKKAATALELTPRPSPGTDRPEPWVGT